MGRVGCELRYLYVVLSDSLYSTFYQTTKYVIKAICLYVILAKYLSFCLNYRHSVWKRYFSISLKPFKNERTSIRFLPVN